MTFQAIAPGIWLHSEYADPPGVGPTRSNGLIVEAGDHSILVDTAWNDAQTGSIVEWAEASLHRPVAAAIVTHAHHDKMGGIAALRSAGIRTFANRLTNADAPKRGLLPADVSLDFDSGGWLTAESARAAEPLGAIRPYFPGAGHTRDNIVVGVADGAVLFGGCLIRPSDAQSLGNTSDGDIAHWGIAARAAGAAFPNATVVIPSHGDIAGRDLIELTARLALAAQAPR